MSRNLTETQKVEMARIAEERGGCSMSSLFRVAVNEFIERNPPKQKEETENKEQMELEL